MAVDIYSVWFSTITSVSLKAKAVVLSYFGTPEAAFRSVPGSFYQVPGLNKKAADVFEERDLVTAASVIAECTIQGISIIASSDERYPERLREIFSPPAVLYVKGTVPNIDELPIVSVIGTRKGTDYGINMGKKLAYQISRCGGTVMSGLTAGIDSAAAEGALIAQAPCVCVLGTPHEKENGKLSQEVLSAGGTLISEYPPGTPQDRGFFRARNRIAAGISIAVVVVEAPEKSGTRLFVNDAVEQGKDIFAVPGSADNPMSSGTNGLIKDGATPVTEGWEVIGGYEPAFPHLIHNDKTPFNAAMYSGRPQNRRSSREAVSGQKERTSMPKASGTASAQGPSRDVKLTEEQRKIVEAIGDCAVTDDVIVKTGLPAARVLSQLTILEIKGVLRREAGKRLRLNNY